MRKDQVMGLKALSLLAALLLGACVEKAEDSVAKPETAEKAVKSPQVPPAAASTPPASEKRDTPPLAVRQADYAITKILYQQAAEILEGEVGPFAARARARLAVYQADCEGALSHLASRASRKVKGAAALFDLATRCSRATAGSVVVSDEEQGIWIRLQDDRDRVLAPLLIEVAARAREGLKRDLGVDFPRPLRIDLVRDLFSLSAVSGLPLEAAETTGTVAVARWGRITMVSPRAMSRGFPWADTLAHEITHLIISLASADRAPLWLQEGIAKREEQRWREVQLFDDKVDFARDAFMAQVSGKSVGVDQLGPSIAMLPSAEAASIAFAEVTAYMDYWIEKNGENALSLLLRDLEVAPDADSAMRSVSGYGVADWQLLWRGELSRRYEAEQVSEVHSVSEVLGPRALSRSLRLTELLSVDGFPGEAADLAAPDLDRASHSSALRFFLARAAQLAERDDADFLLGKTEDVDSAHAGWLALSSARLGGDRSHAEAEGRLKQAYGLDPLLVEVACGGRPWVGNSRTKGSTVGAMNEEVESELCKEARSLPVRGSR